MTDKTTETPEYILQHQQKLAEWERAKNAPMPMPDVPKMEPDEIIMQPMRDGVKLYTELFLPEGEGPHPAILWRTPYPDSTFPFSLRPIELFRSHGYAVVLQSCRGTWKSEGTFLFFQNEPEDGYDCIEGLAAQPWCNGKIGMYGSSYTGSVQWLAARLRPPHLTCIAPQSPAGHFFYEPPYLGGVLFKNHLLTWPRFVARHRWEDMGFEFLNMDLNKGSALRTALEQSPNTEAVTEWLKDDPGMPAALLETLDHPTFDDWWKHIMLTPETAPNIDIPVFAITGFHDGDQAGCLYNWDLVDNAENPVKSPRHLLVGPWRHAQMATGQCAPMGEVQFGENASMSLPQVIVDFFDMYMKDQPTAAETVPERCKLYTSGSNQWHEFSSYPPKETQPTPIYLSSGGHANSLYGDGKLIFDTPTDEPADLMPADWETPVPHVVIGEDASDNETRHDVLVYTSEVLDEDMTVLGPVSADLYMAVDAPDADVVLRVEDVHPDGRAANMTGEMGAAPFRARYREGFEREVLLVPNEPARLQFHVVHMGHTFKKGHRIRLAISATVANALEPNHHTGEPVATAVERRKATQSIFHDSARPSNIVLPILNNDVSSSG